MQPLQVTSPPDGVLSDSVKFAIRGNFRLKAEAVTDTVILKDTDTLWASGGGETPYWTEGLTFRGQDSVMCKTTFFPALEMFYLEHTWNPDRQQVITNRIETKITEYRMKRLTHGVQLGGGYSVGGATVYLGYGINFNLGGL